MLEPHPEWKDRVELIIQDLTVPWSKISISQLGKINYILNVASESHVDRSIVDPSGFIKNNVDLILNMLELSRIIEPEIFLQCSTDEVYGPMPLGKPSKEWDMILPSNPYAASKAAQEAICISYWRTYGLPLVITNCMNMFGERQDPEKFIPMMIKKFLKGEEILLHTSPSPDFTPGSRFYLHARNLADAYLHIIKYFQISKYPEEDKPSRFNIVGEKEVNNFEMFCEIESILNKSGYHFPTPKYRLVDFHSSRPGHDLHYGLDNSLMQNGGLWIPPISFYSSLKKTVLWTLKNPRWLNL